MSLFDRRQLIGGLNVLRKSILAPTSKKSSSRSASSSSNSFFERRKERPRIDMKRHFSKSSPRITGIWGGVKYNRKEREALPEKMFPGQRFGSHISEKEAKLRLKELNKQERWAHSPKEKLEIGRQRRYLEETLGLKGKY